MEAMLGITSTVPAWLLMWLIAAAMFLVCKASVLARTPGGGWRRTAFLCAWPGMDAKAFFHSKAAPVAATEWLAATAKIIFGAVLYFLVARKCVNPLAVGWVAMVGLIFLMHFGGFHILSCAWRTAGVQAVPIMRSPVLATSLGEFWGKRWNLAFNELVERFVFRPFTRKLGVTTASFAAFIASGVIHDLVISVPAEGGWGLPTGYFVLQGLGVAAERSGVGRKIHLRRGWQGWLFTMTITAGPAFFLFHPPFIMNVILPMMRATYAL
jgi:D-alanyl-lipoteichoic acid acyltransferase DltB (MBOAT superfamily)